MGHSVFNTESSALKSMRFWSALLSIVETITFWHAKIYIRVKFSSHKASLQFWPIAHYTAEGWSMKYKRNA